MGRNTSMQRVSNWTAEVAALYSDIKGVTKVQALEELLRGLIDPLSLSQDDREMICFALDKLRARLGVKRHVLSIASEDLMWKPWGLFDPYDPK